MSQKNTVKGPHWNGRIAKGVLSGIAVSRIRTPVVSALVGALWMVGRLAVCGVWTQPRS